ncbi:uncharacterized protein L3040_007165 [Drepanopeziza brunnea f. sp. 'multigermtubi']|uniref:uncharacterized protein n=1 Tax=Drepanopeziza brunnea f. sp. 'multigermtubi' TaxID=698441 RepID=UPI002391B77A|nr:hypothetical protein L3040_007165 [Drepanopeziza brunnea f. sp. 'multigermtubi']
MRGVLGLSISGRRSKNARSAAQGSSGPFTPDRSLFPDHSHFVWSRIPTYSGCRVKLMMRAGGGGGASLEHCPDRQILIKPSQPAPSPNPALAVAL